MHAFSCKHLVSIACGMMAAGLLGCDSPGARNELAQREAKLQKSIRMVKSVEDNREEKLQKTLRMLEAQHANDHVKLHNSLTRLEEWIDEEQADWEHKKPLYREGFEEWIAGDVENIERTWPWVVY